MSNRNKDCSKVQTMYFKHNLIRRVKLILVFSVKKKKIDFIVSLNDTAQPLVKAHIYLHFNIASCMDFFNLLCTNSRALITADI